MPRKVKRTGVEIAFGNDGALRAEDLPYDASNDTKSEIISKTAPTVTVNDDGKVTQAYYDAPPVYGDEGEGNVTISAGGSGTELTYINDVTDMIADAGIGAVTINVRDASAFSAGDEVMLHQTQCYRDVTKRFQYCFRTIASVDTGADTITFTVGLQKAFDSDSGANTGEDTKTQVIRVPNYNTLTLNSGGGICARPWNGFTGGILAFRAKTLAGSGIISARDAGFRNSEFYNYGNADRSARGEGPLGASIGYTTATWDPTAASENYNAAKHTSGSNAGIVMGGSAYEGVNSSNTGTGITPYLSTPYTSDGSNVLVGTDFTDQLPISIGQFTYNANTFRNPYEDFKGSGSPRNINTQGSEQAGGSIICFVQSHAGFTGSFRSDQLSGFPNGAGYIAVYAESAFTGTMNVTTAPKVNSTDGDDGLAYSAAPSSEVIRGFSHGPKIVTTNAASAAADLMTRAAMDERYQDIPAEGAFVDGDKTKLDGIEAGADVTDATNVDAAGATMNADTDVSANSWVVDEDNMASNLATKVPTQQSVKAYVDSATGSSSAVTDDITQTAHGLAVGNPVYFDGTDWQKAKSDASTTLGVGIVSAVADANNFTVTYSGDITGLTGLTSGEYYYVSSSVAGDLTTTEGTAFSNPILLATSTTTGIVLPYRATQLGSSRQDNLSASAAPTANDDTGSGYEVGSLWIDTTNDEVYRCVDATSTAAVWKRLSNPAETCAFHARRTTTQSINNATTTKVQINSEQFDLGGDYDPTTNYRFTAPVAGKYQLNASLVFDSIPSASQSWMMLYKNGTEYARLSEANGGDAHAGSIFLEAAASDYFEIYVRQSSVSADNLTAAEFSGFLVTTV